MPGQRSRKILTAVINGNPLLAEIEEYTPPHVEKVMEESRGGKLIPDEVMVGIQKLEAEFKIVGASQALLSSYGVGGGEISQVDVRSSEQDKDGLTFAIADSVSGEIVSVKEEAVKMGSKPSVMVKMSLVAYKKTENGVIVYDINTTTQKIDLGSGDIMAVHRRNVGLP